MFGTMIISVMGAHESERLIREAEDSAIADAVSGLPEGERASAAYKLRCERDAANAAQRSAAASDMAARSQAHARPSTGDAAMAGVVGFILGSAIS